MSRKKNDIPVFRYENKNRNKSKEKGKGNIFNDLDNRMNNQNNEFIKIIPLNNKEKQNDNIFFPPSLTTMIDAIIKNEPNKNDILESDKIFNILDSVKYDEINLNINTLDELIKFGKLPSKGKVYPFDINKLKNIVPTLDKLSKFIGMDNVKKSIILQVLYFLQDFEECDDMMHTVITGPPGVGKTMLAFVLGEIYYKLGVVKKIKGKKFFKSPLNEKEIDFKFRIAKRSDLIGEYVGHTAIKTQKVIDESLGGVLFIDEAYSLGNEDKKDIYSKECIDTINQNLTEKKGEFVVIIAGYENDLETCFFNYNDGLRRRFPFRYEISPYNHEELGRIFLDKVKSLKWKLDGNLNMDKDGILYNFFKDKYKYFKNYGGDMETLLFSCKICHSKRIFGKDPKLRKTLSFIDIEKGFENFREYKKINDNVSLINLYI